MQRTQIDRLASDTKARLYLGGSRDAYGGLRTTTFDRWAADQEVKDNKIRLADLKQQEVADKEKEERAKRKAGGKG